jgi:hypothetical protein
MSSILKIENKFAINQVLYSLAMIKIHYFWSQYYCKIWPMKSAIIFIASFIVSCILSAQVPVCYMQDPFFAPADSQKLFVRINNKTFFKNNEYFNPLNEGYTLIGFLAQPSVAWHPGRTTRLEAGASLLKYSGRNGLSDAQPIFRFQYQPNTNFQMVMGTLFGGSYHGLIEPLYRWERDFMNPLESGVQFLFHTSRIKADVWLDWEQFIFRNDPFQEKLTVGVTTDVKLLPSDRNFTISVPLQFMVNHHGGQDISIDTALMTFVNYAGGIRASWQNSGQRLKRLDMECWLLGYNDLSPQKLQAYKNGYAIYSKAGIWIGNFMLQAGYFHGETFISTKGEPLFLSAVSPSNGYVLPNRNLVTAKLAFQKKIENGIFLAAYCETYTDTDSGSTDYNYGVHIIVDRDFFIARIR